MLPFVFASLAILSAMIGQRGTSIAFWAFTLVLFAITLWTHMTDRLAISL